MNRKEALQALLAEVEARGMLTGPHSVARKAFGVDTVRLCHSAFHGSLDAAKALHEALLPGWDIQVGTYEDDSYEASVAEPMKVKTFDGVSHWMAHAWLIAILKAIISQEGE